MEKKQTAFHFREDPETKIKRDSLYLDIDYLTQEELVAIMQRPAEDNTVQYIMEALESVVNTHLRAQIRDDENFSQETLDALVAEGKFGLEYIANIPRAPRTRVTNEDLANFGMAFVEVCIALESNPEQRIASERGATVAAQVFSDRLRSAAGKNDVLAKLQAMLEKFVEVAPEDIVSEHYDAINFLGRELEKAQDQDDVNLDALD